MAYAPKGGGKPDKKKPYRDPDQDKRKIAGESKTGLKGPATGALPPLPPLPPAPPPPAFEPLTGLGPPPPAGQFVPEVPPFPNLKTGLPDMNIGGGGAPALTPEALTLLDALLVERLKSVSGTMYPGGLPRMNPPLAPGEELHSTGFRIPSLPPPQPYNIEPFGE